MPSTQILTVCRDFPKDATEREYKMMSCCMDEEREMEKERDEERGGDLPDVVGIKENQTPE